MRCFLAIEITDPAILSNILQFQEELTSINAKIKFVESKNVHFTLRFLGEIDPSMVEKINQIMKKQPFSGFSLTIQGVGTFPSSQPRVIWIGISNDDNNCLSLYQNVNRGLKEIGFKPEKRPFSPHITVGRIKFVKDMTLFKKILQKWHSYEFGTVKITKFQLKKSDLTPKGPIYTTLKEVEADP